ncbi:hypothetical protein [Flindersiella endophytica]
MVYTPSTTEEFNTWREGHPDGYLLNHYRRPTKIYLILHRATCSCFERDQEYVGEYGKTCAARIVDLRVWAQQVVGAINVAECGRCKPV